MDKKFFGIDLEYLLYIFLVIGFSTEILSIYLFCGK